MEGTALCDSCRRGDFVTCQNEAITGITRDGSLLERRALVAVLLRC
jgi:D-arabinose 1-dehydrogenase-like Zn-dependent alcohol dehydrogenase